MRRRLPCALPLVLLALAYATAADAQPATTTRVSVATGGTQGTGGAAARASISADGRYVAFDSTATNLVAGDTNGFLDVFVHDRRTGATTRVSVATGSTCSPSRSARYLAPFGQ